MMIKVGKGRRIEELSTHRSIFQNSTIDECTRTAWVRRKDRTENLKRRMTEKKREDEQFLGGEKHSWFHITN